MHPPIGPRSGSSAAASSVTTTRSTALTPPASEEEVIDSINADIFGRDVLELSGGEPALKKSSLDKVNEFLTKIIANSETISSQQEAQIVFLENVFSKLDSINIELQKADNPADDGFKEYFKESTNQVEACLIQHLNTLNHKYKEFSALIFEEEINKKVSTLTFPKTGFTGTTPNKSESDLYKQINSYNPNRVTNAKGENFTKKGDGISDGNCGLNACFQTTNTTSALFDKKATREHLVKLHHAYETVRLADNTGDITSDNLTLIFGNVSNCKRFLEKALEEKLALPDLTNKERFQAMRRQIGSISNFNNIITNPELLQFIQSYVKSEFSENAHLDRNWLTTGDIEAIMLSKGYFCINQGIQQGDDEPNLFAQTVMEFQHLSTGHNVFIANNAKPRPENQSVTHSASGSHWVCVEKASSRTT